MPAGRPRMPSAIRKLRGEKRPSQFNQNEPDFELSLLAPPKDLPKSAVAVWKRVAVVLHNARVLTTADEGCLRGYCVSHARMTEAETIVCREGVRIEEQRGTGDNLYVVVKENPAYAIEKSARKQMNEFARELGLTPSSRGKVNALPAATQTQLGNMRKKLKGLKLVK